MTEGVPRFCGLLLALNSMAMVGGWLFRIPRLTSLGLDPALPTSPTTAVLFLMLGAVLSLDRSLGIARTVRLSVAAGTALIGAARLVDLLMGLHTHFDQWLLHDRLAERGLLSTIGVAPTTAAGFFAVGAGLLLIDRDGKRQRMVGQSLVIVTLLLGWTAVIGHLYHALKFYQVGQLFPMAPMTAVNFVLAAIGVIWLRPDLGFSRVLTAPYLGGVVARRLLPVIVIVPPLLGLLSLDLTRLSGLEPISGVAALVTLTGVVLATAALGTAHHLEKTASALLQRSDELQMARIAAEGANRTKSEFLANMSHELRTPLNAVIGFSEIMREASFGPLAARYREYAGDIFDSGNHLLTVVNQILDLAKIEADQLALNEDWIFLSELAAGSLMIIQERALKGDVALRCDVQPNLPLLFADPTRIKQILLNLLSNAVKFTGAGGTVSLSARVSPEGVELRIADTGIGMNEEELAVAFMPFRQVDSALSRRYEGTGLGLPLAKALVEQHGGTLVLESRQGLGTTAIIRLPAGRVGPRPTDDASVPNVRSSSAS